MDSERLDAEIDANYDYFRRNLTEFMGKEAGHYALLHAAELVGFFRTVGEAARAGAARFPDGLYSIQEVIDEPIDLGFFSHVGG